MINKENKKIYDYVIIGGGFTSFITAYYLKDLSDNILIIDNNYANTKSNIDSYTLYSQQIDIDLFNLSESIGKNSAINMYEKSLHAIHELESICKKIDLKTEKCSHLYYTIDKNEINKIVDEYEQKNKAGFDVKLIDNTDLINIKKGILTNYATSFINIEKFIKNLSKYLKENNVKIIKRQNIHNIVYNDNVNNIIFQDDVIRAKNIIFSDEIEMKKYYKNDFTLNYSFYIITEQLNEKISFCTARDTSFPYKYIKFTPNNKIILKGNDISFDVENIKEEEININKIAKEKFSKLKEYIKSNFNLKDEIKIDKQFFSSFIAPKENFPIIDKIQDMENCYVNIGSGQNGILYSIIGANLLKNLFEIKK